MMEEDTVEQAGFEQAVPEIPKESGLSLKGLVQVFFKPTEFFQKLKDDPKVLVPYLILGVVVAAFFLLASDLIAKVSVQSQSFQDRMQGQPVTPQLMTFMKYNIMIGGTIAYLVAPLLIAGLAYFWGSFVMAGKARFKQVLSVSLYSELIWGVGMLLAVPFMIMKGSAMFSFSLAILAAQSGPESLLFVALSKVNLFLIWEIIVAGIGFSIFYNVPRNKGYWISVLSVGLLSAVQVIWTAISKMIF
jgi:hypothetical protein